MLSKGNFQVWLNEHNSDQMPSIKEQMIAATTREYRHHETDDNDDENGAMVLTVNIEYGQEKIAKS